MIDELNEQQEQLLWLRDKSCRLSELLSCLREEKVSRDVLLPVYKSIRNVHRTLVNISATYRK